MAEDVVIDNMQMSILLVHGREKKNEIMARLAKEWSDLSYKVKRNEASGWDVLSALSDTCMTTLQLGDRPAAFGYLAVNKLKKSVRVARGDMPVPPGGGASRPPSTATTTADAAPSCRSSPACLCSPPTSSTCAA
ncbi:hypothetical protein LP420_11835 [Massilia sp. B-10]|nr:hypothetical protein LP420_11835 [Massilia sp. B-10]